MIAEWKTGILTEEKTMEMLYEWWRWICHSLCHAMTMTYKIQDTALSQALHCHRCNNSPTTWAPAYSEMRAKQLSYSISVWHCIAQDLGFKLRWDILSDLITDHFNRAADPPLWTNPKHVGQNRRPLDAFIAILHSLQFSRHTCSESTAAQRFSCVFR